MSNYQRLISYIYTYEGGIKGKNIGFVKLETRNIQCKITVNVKKIFVGGNPMGVYLLSNQGEVRIGELFARNGAGEFRTTVNAANIENSGRGIEEFYGLSIHDVESAWRSYTTIWEDAVAHAAEVELSEVTAENVLSRQVKVDEAVAKMSAAEAVAGVQEEQLPISAEIEQQLSKEDGSAELPQTAVAAEAGPVMVQLEAMPQPEIAPGPEIVPGPEMWPQPEIAPGPETAPGPEILPQPEMWPQPETAPGPEILPQPEMWPQPETAPGPEILPQPEMWPQPETAPGPEILPQPEMWPQPETAPGPEILPEPEMWPGPETLPQPELWPRSEAWTQSETPSRTDPSPRPWTSLGSGTAQQPEMQRKPAACADTRSKQPAAPEQPRSFIQVPREEQELSTHQEMWHFLRKRYAKILAFDYEDGCEILTVKPQDIGLLPRDNWVFGNNSFLLHGYYNYRYLILARLENPEGNPRYLLGVPGNYYSNEKYMAAMFGFSDFVLSKKQPSKDSRFGYWYTDVKIGE